MVIVRSQSRKDQLQSQAETRLDKNGLMQGRLGLRYSDWREAASVPRLVCCSCKEESTLRSAAKGSDNFFPSSLFVAVGNPSGEKTL